MSKAKMPVADFAIVGQLLDVIIKDGYKIKYLRLIFEEREYWIKVPKELRNTLDPRMIPGCWLEVSGTQKRKKTGIVQLTADTIALAKQQPKSELEAIVLPKLSPKACVLVCQKSTCRKRGGEAVCHALEAELRDRGLGDRVKIRTTGCLKQCKQGPNLVVMPDKARYSNVSSAQIPALIEKHFTND